MRGYSGSGKSTKAAEIAQKTGAVIVNRDQIRKMLFNSWWTGKPADEELVTVAERAQVAALLKSGKGVIVDATHLHPPYLRKWAKFATEQGYHFEVVDVRVDPAMCIARDAKRERSVGNAVINKQASRWPMHTWPQITATPFVAEPVGWVDGLEEAIIVDIDGTLAHMGSRNPFDLKRVGEDSLDETIREIVHNWQEADPNHRHVIIMSGRDDTCRRETEQWLFDHDVKYCELIMRPPEWVDGNGGKLADYIVKSRLYDDWIKGVYNVRFVLDDRQQVVDMWRKRGLKCLQVQPGDF